jgi:CHASE3 domain sensor protein
MPQSARHTMPRTIRIGAVLVLLVAAAGTLALMIAEYRRDSDRCRLLYTRYIKKKDIIDNARNALAALNDAELRAQNYVLTGETIYSEAYADDIRAWQDESGSLELVAIKDPATPLAQDLSKAGTRTMNELALVVSLFEKNGREAALERIRKGAGIVYLDQARSSVGKIQDIDGAPDLTMAIILRSLLSLRRLAEGAVVLFLFVVAGTVLLVLDLRRGRHEAGSFQSHSTASASN